MGLKSEAFLKDIASSHKYEGWVSGGKFMSNVLYTHHEMWNAYTFQKFPQTAVPTGTDGTLKIRIDFNIL